MVEVEAAALDNDFSIPFEAKSIEGSQYPVGRAGNRAWRIDIFNTHQPFATARAGIEIAANGRNE